MSSVSTLVQIPTPRPEGRARPLLWRRALLAALALTLVAACDDNKTVPTADISYEVPPGQDVDPDAQIPMCIPNYDGRIDAHELAPAFGIPVTYLASPVGAEAPVDLLGTAGEGEQRYWDWSWTAAQEERLAVAALPIASFWFAEHFPADAFVVPMDRSSGNVGIYRHSTASFALLGMASREESPATGKTLLIYQEPVEVYRFPLRLGDEWVAIGNIRNGVFMGFEPFSGQHLYDVQVRAAGEIKLLDFTFKHVLRISTQVTMSGAGQTITTHQSSFLTECYGEVARATSRTGESQRDFGVATELRRIGL